MKLLTTGIEKFDLEKFNQIQNDINEGFIWNKPFIGGLYSSSLYQALYVSQHKYESEWTNFCKDCDIRIERLQYGFVFELKSDSKICTINNLQDYLKILESYSFDYDCYDRHKKGIDWEKLAKDYDAFYLSRNAVIEMRMFIDQDKRNLVDFFNWDVETMLVLNPNCIDMDSVEYFDEREAS